ncbi:MULTISPECIES: AAA family ATPase [unclassified Rhizobium]|uniref:AAA family ATPase n=1 Tax=unclassified Rhizobium TaxID=2613769 RepID=UPI002889B4CB|nr:MULTISPECIES: AAA family ATPase [unclassified Rhizobium]
MLRSDEPKQFKISEFSVFGLLGDKNYTLEIGAEASIIVGPNGAGKSNFLSIFYLVISRQWAKLTDYSFAKIIIKSKNLEIHFDKDDLLEMTSYIGENPRYKQLYTYLVENNIFGNFVSSESIPLQDRRVYSEMFKIPTMGISTFHSRLRDEVDHAKNFIAVESLIEKMDLGLIIFMPTYRRIEKDLRNFLPEAAQAPRDSGEPNSPQVKPRAYIEVIGAGMRDVRRLIENKIHSIAIAKQRTTERAAQEYILDIVRGSISNFSLNRLKNIDEDSLLSFIETLDNSIFRKQDKARLKSQILGLRNRPNKAPKAEERYLGLYVEKLLQAQERIGALEEPLRKLTELASQYIGSDKIFNFVESPKFRSRRDENEELDLEVLSSGEKQILAMFSYLLLSDDSKCILIVDEPELSLSVPWQKTLLPDIISTGNCAHVFAVTHSPFIFSNRLQNCLVDTQSMEVVYA